VCENSENRDENSESMLVHATRISIPEFLRYSAFSYKKQTYLRLDVNINFCELIMYRELARLFGFLLLWPFNCANRLPYIAFATSSMSELTHTEGTAALPQLPAPSDDANIPRLRLGEKITLEGVGPIILNSDGTTRRIANWDQMSPQEQAVSWRRISKRNEERRQKLLLDQQQADSSNDNTQEEL